MEFETPRNNNEDLLFVQETLKGDRNSFARLIDKYKNLVFSISLRMLGNHADAEDCSQEVFIQAYRHLKDLKINTKFYSWIYSIAINTCKNRLKKKNRTETVELDETQELETRGPTQNVEQETISKHDANRKVSRIMQILPEKYRIPFFLRYMEDRNYEEIARITKLPLGTVKTYIHRAFNIIIMKKNEIETF